MPETLPPDAAPRRRRTLWIVLGTVALLVTAGLVVAALRLDAIVNALKDRQVAELSKTLGRPITVGKVTTSIFPPSAELRDVLVPPDPRRPAETLPVVSLARLRVGIATKTLWSLGKRPGLTEVLVEGLTVNVVKHTDQTLNWVNFLEALPKTETREPPRPMDEATKEMVRAFTVDRVRLVDGRARFVDLGRGGATVEIGQLGLALDDVSLVKPVVARLEAAVLGPARNFRLEAALGPAPAALDAAPPLERLTVKLERTDLAPLVPFLTAAMPADLAGLEQATLALDLLLQPGAAVPGGKGGTSARGELALTGMRFRDGEPFDLRLGSDLSAELAPGSAETVDIRRFLLAIGPMAVEARGKLAGLRSEPRFSDFVVTSKDLDFDRLRKLLPDLDRRAGATLRGPFSLSAKAGGGAAAQRFEAGVDLTGASIEVPAALRKPAGVPLAVSLAGSAQGDGVDVERLSLQVSSWQLTARGTVRKLKSPAPVLAFTASAETPGLGGVLRLLPPVADGLPPKAKLDAALALDAKVAGTVADLHAELAANLSRLAVKVPGVALGGGGTINLVADRKGRALTAKVRVNLTALQAIYLDVIRKAAGVPLALDLVATDRAPVQDVRLDLRAADLKVNGKAELRPQGDDQAIAAELIIPPFSVRSLTAMLPALREAPLGDVRAGARILVRGRLGAPSSMEVRIEDLALDAGRSDLRGRLSVVDLERPKVELEARSSYLDLDDFMPPGKKKEEKKSEGDPLAGVTGRARLDVAKGRAAGIDFHDLRADLALDGGRGIAKTLEVGVFGGSFSGAGTELSPLDPQAPFKAKGVLKRVDLDAVVSHFAGAPNLLAGRLDADLQVGAGGTATEVLVSTLTGLLEGRIEGAQLFGGGLIEQLMTPVAAKVNALPGAGKLLDPASAAFKKHGDKALAELRAAAKFGKGAIDLGGPINTQTGAGPLALQGKVLLAGRWDLTGLLTLSPAAATALTGNRLRIDRPVPIKLSITGPLARPKVAPTALDEVAKVFALAFAQSAAGQAAKAKLAEGAQKVLDGSGLGAKLPPGAGATSVAEAKAKAEAEAAEARARAAAETERLRLEGAQAKAQAEADAKARAAEAERKAKEAAKAKVRGLFGQ